MTSFYDEVEIEDFDYDAEKGVYFYPCPCGDRFQITKASAFDLGGAAGRRGDSAMSELFADYPGDIRCRCLFWGRDYQHWTRDHYCVKSR